MSKVKAISTGLNLILNTKPSNINWSKVGYVHKNGAISFADNETALEYAKKRVVKALNCENGKKPFERAVIVSDNTILSEIDGNTSAVAMDDIKKYKDFNIVSVHGHTDGYTTVENPSGNVLKNIIMSLFKPKTHPRKIKPNGLTYPVSIQDYVALMSNPNEIKSIVYNAKGEYSILEKLNEHETMTEQELKEIINEYKTTVPSDSIMTILFNRIRSLFLSEKKAECLGLRKAQTKSADIHDFFVLNSENMCRVRYTTNYSNLKSD